MAGRVMLSAVAILAILSASSCRKSGPVQSEHIDAICGKLATVTIGDVPPRLSDVEPRVVVVDDLADEQFVLWVYQAEHRIVEIYVDGSAEPAEVFAARYIDVGDEYIDKWYFCDMERWARYVALAGDDARAGWGEP